MKTRNLAVALLVLAAVAAAAFVSCSFFVSSWDPLHSARIAFASNGEAQGDAQIFVMDSPSNITQLTSIGPNIMPDWSLDGTKIVYASKRDGSTDEIYVMNADGSNQVRLTNNSVYDRFPSWSPDGTKIVFARFNNANFFYDVYVMNADGSNVIPLATTNAYEQAPRWSPDGTKIVYINNDDVYLMNADGSNQQPLTNNAFYCYTPCFSPDGTKIAFAGGSTAIDIYVMSANGVNQVKLTNNLAVDAIFSSISWSPDSSKIVFSNGYHPHREIYAINSDGSNLVNLSNNTADDVSPSWTRK
jgi:Tol biopolymer transport system component